jgi:hypothetical protein
MGLVPYIFDPKYSVEEIYNCQHLIAEATVQTCLFSFVVLSYLVSLRSEFRVVMCSCLVYVICVFCCCV